MTSLYWLSWKWNDIFKYLKVSDTEDNQILSLQSWNLVSLRQKERTEYIHLHFYFFLNPEVFEWCSLIRLQRISQFISWMGPNVGRPTLSKLGCLWGLGEKQRTQELLYIFGKGEQSYPTSEKSSHFWHINRHASCILFHEATNESEVFVLMLLFQLLENPLYHSVPGFQN